MAQLSAVPRAVFSLHPLITLIGLCMVSVAYRMLYEHICSRLTGSDADVRRAVVIGAGEAAMCLLAMVHHLGWIVTGLLDDDPAKCHARVGSVSVLGPLAAVADPAVRGDATHAIVVLPWATAAERRRAIALAADAGLKVLILPSASELQSDNARIERVRRSEPDGLLAVSPCNWTKPASPR